MAPRLSPNFRCRLLKALKDRSTCLDPALLARAPKDSDGLRDVEGGCEDLAPELFLEELERDLAKVGVELPGVLVVGALGP
eukprot:6653885-Pyramimonas_sp.AAC.1